MVLKIIGGVDQEPKPSRSASIAQAVAAELEVLHEFTERALENVENAFGFLQ